MGRWGSKVPKLSENNHSVKKKHVIFRTLSQNRGGCGWVGFQSPKQIRGIFVRKILIFSKNKMLWTAQKIKVSSIFTFHSVESQTYAVGGWGTMFGTKSQKKTFFLTSSPILSQKGKTCRNLHAFWEDQMDPKSAIRGPKPISRTRPPGTNEPAKLRC